ncbi:MAG TPA: FHA domain-containing protein [Anaerolineales bacterium]|nr:FHA domain-containing protein [Anaerolineales bacterium]
MSALISILIQSGPLAGQEINIEKTETLIGRDAACDVVLNAPGVSRRHARLSLLPNGTIQIEDLGSANGTYVNGVRLQAPLALKDRDLVALGQAVVFNIRVSQSAATVIEFSPVAGATIIEAPLPPVTPAKEHTPVPPPTPAPALMPIKLTIQIGADPRYEVILEKGEYSLGRAEDNDITIDSRVISRYHAKLTRKGGTYEFTPLPQAGNPFKINDAILMRPRELDNGDTLMVGEFAPSVMVTLRYENPNLSASMPEDVGLGTLLPGMKPDWVESTSASAPNVLSPLETSPRNAPIPSPQATAPAQKADIVETARKAQAQSAPDSRTVMDFGEASALVAKNFGKEDVDTNAHQTRPHQGASGATVLGFDELEPKAPQLVVTVAGEVTNTYPLYKNRITVGRATDNDIVVPSKIFSRHHLTLEKVGDGYQAVPNPDAGNPLLFEGRPLYQSRFLQPGDLLRVGSSDPGVMVTMTYQSPQAAVQVGGRVQEINFAGKERISIGRDKTNDIVVDSPNVSRYHAMIERVGQRFRIKDLQSANGTFVNGAKISGDVWLKPDDNIRIGSYRFQVGAESLAQFDESTGLRVEAVGINKWVRKDLNILQDISVVFEPREFVVVVGQSGGGKSTLVDAIAGYRPATHGKVTVNGVDVYKNFDAIRNDIGYVPQKDIIHFELSAYQALDYAAQLRMPSDTTRDERHARVMEVLNDLDLAHRKDIQISRMSGGQQKRVSIGVELLSKPGLFFLDEPTSGLDPGTETELMQMMRRLADQGRTIVLITHATKNVMLADKVVFLARGGYLAWFGPPDEALSYFDQFRTERERRAGKMEFDEVYKILGDSQLGNPQEWAKRFKASPYHQKYVSQPISELELPGVPVASHANISGKVAKPKRKKMSGISQFGILSSRNMAILARDRFSLILMLLIAPISSLLDVVLSLALGRNPFDWYSGFFPNVMITLFLPTVYAVLTGGLSQMREIVKENDIYKRERLVNLKLFPYIMSKIWVAILLALYQAACFTLVHYLAFKMPGGIGGLLLFYITIALCALAGMMIGLWASAAAPNANSAPLILIPIMLAEIVLAGALVPLPQFVSAPTSTRWAFQAFMAITEVGSDVARDVCWAQPADIWASLDEGQKNSAECPCNGLKMLNETSCAFPGIGRFAAQLPEGEPNGNAPVKPGPKPQEPAAPTFPPEPVKPTDESDNVAMAEYFDQLEQFNAQVKAIQADFDNQMAEFREKLAVFENEVAAFQAAKIAFEQENGEYVAQQRLAIGAAENFLKQPVQDFGWLMVNKEQKMAVVVQTWLSQGLIILIVFVLIIVFMRRKDRAE